MELIPRPHFRDVTLCFKPDKHEYYKIVNGKKIILNPASSLNLFNKFWYAQNNMDKLILDRARERGTAFHKMVEQYLISGRYDLIGSKALKERMPVFIEWLDTFMVNKEVLLIEQPLCARELPIAGTPDLFLWDKTDESFIVVDWKGGDKPANRPPNNPTRDMTWELGTRYEPQLRFYAYLISENFLVDINKIKHIIVWLEKHGGPKTHSF